MALSSPEIRVPWRGQIDDDRGRVVLVSVLLWSPQFLEGSHFAWPRSNAGLWRAAAATATAPAPMSHDAMSSDMHAPTIFTLRTGVAEGRMVYLGVGGELMAPSIPPSSFMKAKLCKSI